MTAAAAPLLLAAVARLRARRAMRNRTQGTRLWAGARYAFGEQTLPRAQPAARPGGGELAVRTGRGPHGEGSQGSELGGAR